MNVRVQCMRHHFKTVQQPGARAAEMRVAICNEYAIIFHGRNLLPFIGLANFFNILERSFD